MIRSRLPCPRACRMSGQLEAASLGYCSFTPVSPVHTRSVSALWAMLGPAQCPGDSGRLPPRHPGSLRWLLTHALSWVTGDADGGAQSTWRAPLSTTCIFWHSQPPLCGMGGPGRDAGQALGTCAGTAVASGLLLAPRCCQRPRTLQAFPEHRPVPLVLASPKLLARGCLLGANCPAASSPGTSGQSVQGSDCLACGLLAGAPRWQKRPSRGVAIQAVCLVPRRGGQAGVKVRLPTLVSQDQQWLGGGSQGRGLSEWQGHHSLPPGSTSSAKDESPLFC